MEVSDFLSRSACSAVGAALRAPEWRLLAGVDQGRTPVVSSRGRRPVSRGPGRPRGQVRGRGRGSSGAGPNKKWVAVEPRTKRAVDDNASVAFLRLHEEYVRQLKLMDAVNSKCLPFYATSATFEPASNSETKPKSENPSSEAKRNSSSSSSSSSTKPRAGKDKPKRTATEASMGSPQPRKYKWRPQKDREFADFEDLHNAIPGEDYQTRSGRNTKKRAAAALDKGE